MDFKKREKKQKKRFILPLFIKNINVYICNNIHKIIDYKEYIIKTVIRISKMPAGAGSGKERT